MSSNSVCDHILATNKSDIPLLIRLITLVILTILIKILYNIQLLKQDIKKEYLVTKIDIMNLYPIQRG